MKTWKDVSTYSKNAKDRTPREFELRAGHDRISVHRDIDYPGSWLVSVHGLGIAGKLLEATEVEEAKKEAIEVVKKRLRQTLEALES